MTDSTITTGFTGKTLEELLLNAGNPTKLLRSGRAGAYVFPIIPPEFTNWRDEQRAWKHDVALLELSYHMTELHLRGSDALPLLSKLGVNKFSTFPAKRGKQIVMSNSDGFMVSDSILFHEEEEFYRVVGNFPAIDWVQFHAETGGYDVEVRRDDPSSYHSLADRDVFRIQIQGPNALELMRDVTDGSLPDIGFFHIGEFKIKNHNVRALRHGMAGEPGFEIYGPWYEQQAIRDIFEKAGEKYRMRKIGARAYACTSVESGWLSMYLPAIYTGSEMKPYREWLTASHVEAIGSLGGSYVSDNIMDYYIDPIEAGYGSLIDFNHDFIGRDALAEKIKNPKRKKVTLVWNKEDVADVMRTSLYPDGGLPSKYFNLPYSIYSTFEYDAVLKDGKNVGVSHSSCFTVNADAFISLAHVDLDQCEVGTEVTVLWGEPDSTRSAVEKHAVRNVRAKVASAPYFQKVIKTGKQ